MVFNKNKKLIMRSLERDVQERAVVYKLIYVSLVAARLLFSKNKAFEIERCLG